MMVNCSVFKMAALRISSVGRVLTRINVRPVAAIPTNVRLFATQDTVTHTGQVWDKDDYRNARFTDRNKEVNMNFSINLVAEEPPIEIKGRNVHCDGVKLLPNGFKLGQVIKDTTSYQGGGALGHPKVYINLDQEGSHSCGYCGLRYIKAKDAH